jgi:hypothetical protein
MVVMMTMVVDWQRAVWTYSEWTYFDVAAMILWSWAAVTVTVATAVMAMARWHCRPDGTA